jgi:hypothetical protein
LDDDEVFFDVLPYYSESGFPVMYWDNNDEWQDSPAPICSWDGAAWIELLA